MNRAHGGIDISYWRDNPSQFATDITSTYDSSKRCYLIHLEGNILDNNFKTFGAGYTNGATAYDTEIAPFYTMAESIGWKVCPCTIDMWNDGDQANAGGPLDTFHAYLQASNARMKAREGSDYTGQCLDFASVWPATPDSDPSSYYVVDGTVSGGVDNGRPIAIHKTNPVGWARMASDIGTLFATAIA